MIDSFSCEYCTQRLPIREPSLPACTSCGKPSWPAEVKAIASSGNKIWAIKVYRMMTNLGLKEAKDAVEAFQATGTLPIPGEAPVASALRASGQEQEFLALCKNNPISAIKTYREKTGLGLKESKDAIDAIRAGGAVPAFLFGAAIANPEASTATINTGPSPFDEMLGHLKQGNLINAIKLYREKTGVGLKEAKDTVEAVRDKRPVQLLPPFAQAGAVAATAPVDTNAPLREELLATLRNDGVISAIQLYRARTGVSLKEGKDFIDALEADPKTPFPSV